MRVILTNIHRAFRFLHSSSNETFAENAGSITKQFQMVAESWQDKLEWRTYAGKSDGSISKQWVKETREYFLEFLRLTRFPGLERHGEHGFLSDYPEWLIMLIGVLAVKCKEKTYLGMHRLSTKYWEELCGEEVKLPPISVTTPGATKKNQLPAWSWSRIYSSSFSTGIPAMK